MPKYLVLGQGGSPPTNEAERNASMANWGEWFQNAGTAVVDMGAPFVARGAVGEVAAPTPANGFMMIEANDLEAAQALVRSCPAVAEGQAMELLEMMDMSSHMPQA